MAHSEFVDYADDTTDATEIDGPQKRWLDSIETIPFDPAMRVSDGGILAEGTPPRAVAPVRVPASALRAHSSRLDRRAKGTPPPQRTTQPPRPIARHPYDNIPTRIDPVDVASNQVSSSQDPDESYGVETDIAPLAAIPTPPPMRSPLHAPYGAPALPPHVPTAMALPPQAVMPTQVAQQAPAHVAQALPALVRPYQDGVTPYPVPPWATGQHAVASAPLQSSYSIPQHNLDIYADTADHPQRISSTGPTPSVRPSLGRYLLPFMGGTALLVFVVGYFALRGDTAATPTAPAAAPAAQIAAPVVSEIEEPIAESQLPAPTWKNREAQPTIVAKAAPAVEIEMAPVVASRPAAKAKKASSSSSRRAKRAEIAAIAKPAAKAIAKPAKPTKAVAKSERDPILEEIVRSSKPAAKATGPGKLVVSSSVPTLIYIDGRSTNLMTPKTLNLSPGKHKITLLELQSRKAKTVDIEIAAGAVAKLDKKF